MVSQLRGRDYHGKLIEIPQEILKQNPGGGEIPIQEGTGVVHQSASPTSQTKQSLSDTGQVCLTTPPAP